MSLAKVVDKEDNFNFNLFLHGLKVQILKELSLEVVLVPRSWIPTKASVFFRCRDPHHFVQAGTSERGRYTILSG